MDRYTRITKSWLETRYRTVGADGVYFAHEPIYGPGGPSEPGQARFLTRIFQLLREVRRAGARSLLDVGGSEGLFAYACRELFGMEVVVVDLSAEACHRAGEIFGVPGLAVDSAALPFPDGSFDLASMCEVAEHLSQPVQSILELTRVARRGVLLSTEEWRESRREREHAVRHREAEDHMERNIYCPDDLPLLFDPMTVEMHHQWTPRGHEGFAPNEELDPDLMAGYLRRSITERGDMGGVIVVASNQEGNPGAETPSDDEIITFLTTLSVPPHRPGASEREAAWPDGIGAACPDCRTGMTPDAAGWVCGDCARSFPRERGVASVFPSESTSLEDYLQTSTAAREWAGTSRAAHLLRLDSDFGTEQEQATSWADAEDLTKWECNEDITPLGGGRYEITGVDPQLVSPRLAIDAHRGASIRLRFSARPTTDQIAIGYGEIFWWLDGDHGFSQEARQAAPYPPDGAAQEFVAGIPRAVGCPERYLVRLRLDPTIGPGTLEVHAFSMGEGEPDKWTPPELERWECNDQIQPLGDGRYRVTGSDPRLTSPLLAIDVGHGARIRVRYSVTHEAESGAPVRGGFHWLLHRQDEYPKEAVGSFETSADGTVREHVVEIPPVTDGSVLRQLTFGPTNGPGTVEIHSVELLDARAC